jgi:hypothetical protein
MDTEKIKILRNKISIPLNVAKKLLAENNNDIELSVQKFHKNNINTICRLAECDEPIAEKYYFVCKYDIEKTIKKIHEQLFYLTATPNQPIDKIGFILWTENESLNDYATSRDKSLFIQTKDFEYIINIIRTFEKRFDTTGFNRFDNETMRKIVEQIARIETNDSDVESFFRALIKWLNSKLRYAHNIIIYGNL